MPGFQHCLEGDPDRLGFREELPAEWTALADADLRAAGGRIVASAPHLFNVSDVLCCKVSIAVGTGDAVAECCLDLPVRDDRLKTLFVLSPDLDDERAPRLPAGGGGGKDGPHDAFGESFDITRDSGRDEVYL